MYLQEKGKKRLIYLPDNRERKDSYTHQQTIGRTKTHILTRQLGGKRLIYLPDNRERKDSYIYQTIRKEKTNKLTRQ